MAELDEIRFVSAAEGDKNWETFICSYIHVDQLIRDGWKEEEVEWKPKMDEEYWTIEANGEIEEYIWEDDLLDLGYQSFLGVYQTRDLAIAARKRIKELLGK